MINIKQKFLKFIISFSWLILITACSETKQIREEKLTKQESIDVAIILPLSGQNEVLGKEYAQMVKLGLSDGAKTKIRVTTYDSANAETLNQSLDKILEDGVDIIIGPIYSEETKETAAKIRNKGAIALSLSNNPVLADKQTYIFGHAPMRQLEQITNYFLENKHQNYIALLPEGRYSNTVSKVLKSMIVSNGGNFAGVEFYGNTVEDMEKSLQAVSVMVDNLVANSNETNEELARPVILLADDPANLRQLLDNAQKMNLDKKIILASDSRIDMDSTPHVTTTFTGSHNITNFKLHAKAQQHGINDLSFLHVLAYDAGRLVGTYIGSDYSRSKFIDNLNSQTPFYGASGSIGFIDSIAQRKYDIIKKEGGQYMGVSER